MSVSSTAQPASHPAAPLDRRKPPQRRAANPSFNDPDPLIDTSSHAQRRIDLATLASVERSRGRRSSTMSGDGTAPQEATSNSGTIAESRVEAGRGRNASDRKLFLINNWQERIGVLSDLEGMDTWRDFQTQLVGRERSLSKALHDYQDTVDSLSHIRDATSYLNNAHEEGEKRGLGEIRSLLKAVKDFTKEQGSIQALSARLKMEEKKVEMYDERLRAITHKMGDVQTKEQLWREKQSRRLRYVWAVVSLLLCMWLLVSIIPMQETPQLEAELDPLAPEKLITEEDLEDISSPQVIFGLSQGSQIVDGR